MAPTLGLQIVPTMALDELLATIELAEDLGYDHCMLADEGLMHDVYAVLGAAAGVTSTIQLGPVTNPYTRHPATTAAALATVDELSGGRAFVTLVAGGTMVLGPMGIGRASPAAVMEDTIDILRALWAGGPVDWTGHRFHLAGAELTTAPHDIPIWLAARGERLLALAGAKADGIVLMARADLADALDIVARGGDPRRVYLDRLAYTPEMVASAKELYAYAIMDSPRRMLANLGIDEATIARMLEALGDAGPAAVAPLVTDEMVTSYQLAGSPDQCRRDLAELMRVHRLDTFVINITDPGLEANEALLRDVVELSRGES